MLSSRAGRRRRLFQLYRTDILSPAAGSPVTPPRMVVARPRRQIPQPPRAIVIQTRLPTGGYMGDRPPIQVIRRPVPQPRPRPVFVRSLQPPNVVPPQSRSYPPRPRVTRDLWGSNRPRPTVLHAANANQIIPPIVHVTPPRPIVARDPWAYRRIRPTSMHAANNGQIAPPIVRIVARPPAQPVRARPSAIITTPRAVPQIRRPDGRVIVPPRPPAGRRPSPIVIRTASTVRIVPPRPIVVRPPARPWIRYPAFEIDAGIGRATAIQPTRNIVVRLPVVAHVPPRLIVPALRHPLASPAIHGPMPVISVFGRRWGRGSIEQGFSSQRHRPIIVNPQQPIPLVNPPVAGGSTLPPDLVAACIAWLRLQPAIVAAFGESLAVPKFFSDIAERSIQPPWLAFYEPEEDEGFETKDGTNLASSLAVGTLACEVIGGGGPNGKLYVRQLAETIAQTLTDAPLTFADGTLVYLRRSKRKFPTSREPGIGANVQTYKRILEFDYQIERWAPQSP
jgi:hypothetical protein